MPGQSYLFSSFQRTTITIHPLVIICFGKAFSEHLTRFELLDNALTSHSKTEHFFVSRLDTSLENSLSKF